MHYLEVDPQNNPNIIIIHILQMRKWSSEKLRDMPKVMQVSTDQAMIQTQSADP